MKPYFLGIILFCGVFGKGFSEPESASDSLIEPEERKNDLFADINNATHAFRMVTGFLTGLLESVKDEESKDKVTKNLDDVIGSVKYLTESKEPAGRISFVGPSLKSIITKLEDGVKGLPDAKQIISQVCSINGGKKRYHVDLNVKVNFISALEYCEDKKMESLTIESQDQLEEVYKYLKKISGDEKGRFWSSGSKLGDKKTWKWLTNGKEISVFDWGNGEPNGNADCLRLFINYYNSGFYDDIDCSSIASPICVYT